MKWLIVALALSACTESEHMAAPASPVPRAPAERSLSDGASKIVAAMRSRPDIGGICGGCETFRGAMREAVMKLVISGELNGSPRSDAESAADFLHAHCGQPQAAPASGQAERIVEFAVVEKFRIGRDAFPTRLQQAKHKDAFWRFRNLCRIPSSLRSASELI